MPTDSGRGVYAISVMTELTGVQPQTLRDLEAGGLLTPRRTHGGTRRYSADDVEAVKRIVELQATGLNLEGVRQVLALQAEAARLRAEIERLKRRSSDER
ncbi:MAG: MerR family transcriptional regulator [Nocardioidaceae bacterium]